MANGGEETFSPHMRARMLAAQAAKLAKEGRRAESERVFRKAFDAVRLVKGPLGSLKGDVHERSKLATVLADEAYSAGMSAAFAVEMWRLGCNSGCLSDDERGDTDIFYPVEIMAMARGEKRARPEEDAAPAVACEVEEKKSFPLPWPIRFLVASFRNLFFGEEGGERERP